MAHKHVPANWTALQSDRQALIAAATTAITRLQQIADAASPTNAQVIAAVRDEATYLKHTIKQVVRLS